MAVFSEVMKRPDFHILLDKPLQTNDPKIRYNSGMFGSWEIFLPIADLIWP
jgi:hypothetical protein